MKMMSGGSGNRMHPNPFTAAQWQELELQTLFFKFMMSGLSIPPDLIFSTNGKRSFTTQPQTPHTGIGWSCFKLGVSCRKTDPEPTRCRRTDGKKWRCSRHASGESKYCERHMHRGKNLGTRKLVESSQSASAATAGTTQQSNLTSSLSSGTTCDMKPVKDSNCRTFLGIDSCWRIGSDHHKPASHQKLFSNDDLIKRSTEKRQRMMMYHQFIEESPSAHEKRGSWLSLVI